VFLLEPNKTQWDLNFSVLGFPVRVHPFFWLMCLIMGGSTEPRYVLLTVVVFLVSILVHELGHALMIRRFGRDAYIVLYGMGGLAIEGSNNPYASSYHPRGDRRTAQEQIYISLAGPVAQLLLAGLLLVFVKLIGGHFEFIFFHKVMPLVVVLPGPHVSEQLALLLFVALQVNIGWALMNLLPVFPLDGGQIAMQLLMLRDSYGGQVRALQLSIGVAVAVCLFALVTMGGGGWYLVLLFGSLAYSNYMTYMQIHGSGGGRW
jgi:stage IV sporulation protein FB